MKKRSSVISWLPAAATLLLAALLIVQCCRLYATGLSAQQLDPAAVIYAPQRIRHFARPLLLPLMLWLASLIFAGLRSRASVHPARPCRPAAAPAQPAASIRLLLLAAAAVLIVLGVLNGGLFDVLAKAINICTECIGLG